MTKQIRDRSEFVGSALADSSDDETTTFQGIDNNNNNMLEMHLDNLMLRPNANTSNRLQLLLNYAHPLIVVDANLLEESFVQLKEIIGAEEESSDLATDDEQLVRLLIVNDFDLNRVVPIVLNFE